jgi:hypothetical protein
VSIARDMDVLGANERFTGNGGEIIAGAVLPLSARFALMADVHANSIKLDKTVTRNGQSVPVTMSYNPVYITATLMYYVF